MLEVEPNTFLRDCIGASWVSTRADSCGVIVILSVYSAKSAGA